MIKAWTAAQVVALGIVWAPAGFAGNIDPNDILLRPYPDRIQALKIPVNVGIRYGKAPKRRFVTDIIWGPEKAPGLYRLNATGSLEITSGKDGPVLKMTRDATSFTFGPKKVKRKDKGGITANITPLGRYRKLELRIPGLDTKAHRAQFTDLGSSLIDTGRIPPFRRLELRAGPDDTAGKSQFKREKNARIDILEAMQPVLGMILEFPERGLHTGQRLTVLRRDLGDLFRDAGPVPLRVEGVVAGIAEIDTQRFLAIRLDRADITPPMRANISGYALVDIETGLPETVVANIELVVLHGTDASVFNFVERRALISDVPLQ